MIDVYLIQPNYRTGYGKNASAWFPYSVATCWTYAATSKLVNENFSIADIIYTRDHIPTLVDKWSGSPNGVYLFSNYVWNYKYNKTLSKLLKDTYPECTIVFGGPSVPKDWILLGHSDLEHVDVCVHGHGEQSLMNILENIVNDVPNERVMSVPMRTLDTIPSPYTTGLFDQIVEKESLNKMRATLETNRGCPFACTFCDWGDLSYNKVLRFPMQKVMDEIHWMSDNKVKLLNIADANIGMFKERDEEILTEVVRMQEKTGFPSVVDGAWYKNSQERNLKLAQMTTGIGNNKSYTLSMQTLNPKTSEAIKRKNMSFDEIKNILTKAEEMGIRSYSEFILGLPYETLDTWKDGFVTLIEAGQHSHLDGWFAQMLVNSELASPASKKKHEMETVQLFDYIGAVGQFDDIDEEYEIVRSTKYMPFDDIVDGYMFAWLVINFHIKGWTHIYSRFNRTHNNQSYKDFYFTLLDKVIDDDGICGTEYNRMKQMVKTYLTIGRVDTWVPGSQLLYDSTRVFSEYADEVKEFLRPLLCISDKVVEDDVAKLQDYFNASPYRTYPMKLSLNHNIPEYITHRESLSDESCPFEYTLQLPNIKYLRGVHARKEIDTWRSMLFYRSKNGWGKVSVERNDISILR
jgi:radical SAM superfamily enzyme YgiQ (UPF0313 family)